jgi:DUF4097 and DUF4098 domain-containing protein YvlB
MKKTIVTTLLFFIGVGGLLVFLKLNGEQRFEKQKSFDGQQIQILEIDNESWNIVLENTDSDELKINIEGSKQKKQSDPVEIEEVGQKLSVLQRDTEAGILKNISIGEKGTIHIAIPKNSVNLIAIRNSYGDLRINHLATEVMTIIGESGSTIMKGLAANKGEFTSKDGEINILDSSLEELLISATNGDSYITNVSSTKAKITSSSGQVVLKEIDEEKSLSVETDSGDITMSYKNNPQSLELAASSDSSDITVDLKGLNKKDVSENSMRGTIGEATNKLELVSKAGIINVK